MKSTLSLRTKYPDLKLPPKSTDVTKKVTDVTGDMFNPEKDQAYYNKVEQFHKHIKPTLSKRQQEVFEVVQTIGPSTMHKVASFMHRELYTISGRFGELVKKDYLKETGKVDGKTIYEVK